MFTRVNIPNQNSTSMTGWPMSRSCQSRSCCLLDVLEIVIDSVMDPTFHMTTSHTGLMGAIKPNWLAFVNWKANFTIEPRTFVLVAKQTPIQIPGSTSPFLHPEVSAVNWNDPSGVSAIVRWPNNLLVLQSSNSFNTAPTMVAILAVWEPFTFSGFFNWVPLEEMQCTEKHFCLAHVNGKSCIWKFSCLWVFPELSKASWVETVCDNQLSLVSLFNDSVKLVFWKVPKRWTEHWHLSRRADDDILVVVWITFTSTHCADCQLPDGQINVHRMLVAAQPTVHSSRWTHAAAATTTKPWHVETKLFP